MCLDVVTANWTAQRIGWKVFRKNKQGKLESEFRRIDPNDTMPVGKWITDPMAGGTITELGVKYPNGFHIFLDKETAVTWAKHEWFRDGTRKLVVAKVKFRKTVAVGTEGCNVAVAQQIYIVPGTVRSYK